MKNKIQNRHVYINNTYKFYIKIRNGNIPFFVGIKGFVVNCVQLLFRTIG